MTLMCTQPVGFCVEYYDPVARLVKKFVLTYFPDRKLQLVDAKTGKTFLAKIYAKDVSPSDLYIGSTVVVFSRELSIVGYGDETTRKHVEALHARAFIMVLPSAMGKLGEIISAVQSGEGEHGKDDRKQKQQTVIANARMCYLGGARQEGQQQEERQGGKISCPPSLASVLPQKGSIVALEVIADARRGGFKGIIGMVDRLRRNLGGDGIFASGTPAEAKEHIRYTFEQGGLVSAGKHNTISSSAVGIGSGGSCLTLCVVKPHVVRGGGLGALLSLVSKRGFKVAALRMMSLGEVGTEELLRPYRGVVSYHADAVQHLKSGNSVALQIEGSGNVVEEFREACGPADPEVARVLYPDTIRALLGVQQATNAVHCTDLPEDGLLECQYVFGVLARGHKYKRS